MQAYWRDREPVEELRREELCVGRTPASGRDPRDGFRVLGWSRPGSELDDEPVVGDLDALGSRELGRAVRQEHGPVGGGERLVGGEVTA